MASRNISPNRMELMRLRRELDVARRGHRLLKDKRDGMMQIFLELAQENVRLRRESDRLLGEAAESMALARAVLQPEILGEALQLGSHPVSVRVEERQIMAVPLPEIEIEADITEEQRLPRYGLAMTSADVDVAVARLGRALPALLKLASIEKQVQLMAAELEKTRRRVNSLEHILIPDLEENIRAIRLKMDENERDNLTRLMKVKDMITESAILERRARNQQGQA